MIDISSERLLTLSAAAHSLPGKPHPSTLHRWRLRGVRGQRLDTILVGGVRYTSAEALQKFCEATTAAADGLPAPVRNSKQREAAIRKAEKAVAAAGL